LDLEKRQQRRWEAAAAADAEGRRDLRRDAREGGKGNGREVLELLGYRG